MVCVGKASSTSPYSAYSRAVSMTVDSSFKIFSLYASCESSSVMKSGGKPLVIVISET